VIDSPIKRTRADGLPLPSPFFERFQMLAAPFPSHSLLLEHIAFALGQRRQLRGEATRASEGASRLLDRSVAITPFERTASLDAMWLLVITIPSEHSTP
jgi:hypothetical protein